MTEISEPEEITYFSITAIIGRSIRDVADYLHINHCFECVKVKRHFNKCVYIYQRDFGCVRKIVICTKGTAHTEEFVDKINVE